MSRGKKSKDVLEAMAAETMPPRPTDPTYEDMDRLEDEFQEAIRTDPKYSLDIDPTGRYAFSPLQTEFIRWMVQYKNVQFVSTVMLNIPIEQGISIYQDYPVQCEIKRINMAMYARRFATKMADLDQLGGYLTSGLIDDNVPMAERWSPKDKLAATKLLMTLNAMKKKGLGDPGMIIEGVEIQKDLEKLSPNDLKQLIMLNDDDEEKDKLIALINEDGLLTMEEIKNLKAMSVEELEELATTVTGGIGDEGDE